MVSKRSLFCSLVDSIICFMLCFWWWGLVIVSIMYNRFYLFRFCLMDIYFVFIFDGRLCLEDVSCEKFEFVSVLEN